MMLEHMIIGTNRHSESVGIPIKNHGKATDFCICQNKSNALRQVRTGEHSYYLFKYHIKKR